MKADEYAGLKDNFETVLKQMKVQKNRLDEKQILLQDKLEKELDYGFNSDSELARSMQSFIEWNMNCRVHDIEMFNHYDEFFKNLSKFLMLVDDDLQEASVLKEKAEIALKQSDEVSKINEELTSMNSKLTKSISNDFLHIKRRVDQNTTILKIVFDKLKDMQKLVELLLDDEHVIPTVASKPKSKQQIRDDILEKQALNDTKPDFKIEQEDSEHEPEFEEEVEVPTVTAKGLIRKMTEDNKKLRSVESEIHKIKLRESKSPKKTYRAGRYERCSMKGCLKAVSKNDLCVKHYMESQEGDDKDGEEEDY